MRNHLVTQQEQCNNNSNVLLLIQRVDILDFLNSHRHRQQELHTDKFTMMKIKNARIGQVNRISDDLLWLQRKISC